jgi:RNA polymerase sigma factor (sigma-70 family)
MTTARATFLRHVHELATAEATHHLQDRQLLERFAARHDEAAFAALVRRHGPLVWGVCRRVLHNWHDAEEAFQATFLALARKANGVGAGGSVSSWLYRVAYHVALRARARAGLRQQRERQVGAPPRADPLDEVTGRELLAVLDEEMQKLPERLRAPLVLCYLQGKTRDEAARELGWSLGTLKRRLEGGRQCLRARLLRRGVALPAALLAAGLAPSVGPAAVPAALAGAAVKAALLATGQGAQAIPASVVALADGVLRAGKLKAAAALVLTLAVLALGAGALIDPAPPDGGKPQPEKRAVAAPPPPTAEANGLTVTGRVLTPDGKPAAGAQVAAVVFCLQRITGFDGLKVAAQGQADREGRYRLTLPPLPAGEKYTVYLKAAGQGYALGAQFLESGAARPEATITLVAEKVARGRLINIEGAPAAGVKVRVVLDNYAGQTPEGAPWPGPVTTDDQGRFTIRGVGKGYRLTLEIQDDRFVRQRFSLEVGARKDEENTLTLAPLRVIEGKVTAQDTGKPVPDARVVIESVTGRLEQVEGRTDAAGRYRIIPYDGNQMNVLVLPPSGVPYLPWRVDFTWAGGAVKRTVDLKVRRGVLARGKVTEAGSGKPLADAEVHFRPRRKGNPFYAALSAFLLEYNGTKSGADGTFQIAVPPGPGHLLVKGPGPDYLHVETSHGELEGGKPGGQRYYPDALIPLDRKPDAEPVEVAAALRRGVTVRGGVVGPDGKPVVEGAGLCRSYLPLGVQFGPNTLLVQDGAFSLPGCDPEKANPVYFLDARKQTGAVVEVSGKQAQGGPVTVRLAPCGSARVRFVDQKGRPWAKERVGEWPLFVHLFLVVTPGATTWAFPDTEALQSDAALQANLDTERWRALRTDAEGRVTIPTLIPGGTYHLMTGDGLGTVKKEFTVKAGQVLDLGDVSMKRQDE